MTHADPERQRLGLLDLTVCEVLQGVSTEAAAARVRRTRRRFEVFNTAARARALRRAFDEAGGGRLTGWALRAPSAPGGWLAENMAAVVE
jgi:hypothetical protein